MSDVDKEQARPDAPTSGSDDEVTTVAVEGSDETGGQQTATGRSEEPPAAGDGADVKASGSGQSDEPLATGKSEGSGEDIEEVAEGPEVPVADDGVKEVSRGGGTPRAQAFRRYWPFIVLGVTTLVLIVGLFLAISGDKDPAPEADKPPTPAALGPMETFTDPAGGFTIRYPQAWRRIQIPPEASDLRIVLSTGVPDPAAPPSPNPTGNDGMWVRVVPAAQVEQKYADFAAEIKALTGDKPCGTEGSTCLRPEPVSFAGMNGIKFAYAVPDSTGGQNSIHVQYFLRRNQQGNLYVIVFQAIPITDLSGLQPAFDEVLASFKAA